MADDPLSLARAALLPADGLSVLADARQMAGVRVVPGDERTWVAWDGPLPDLARRLLGVPGAALYEPTAGGWRRLGRRLPDFDVPPPGPSVPADRAVVPSRPATLSPSADPLAPVRVTLVPGGRPRPATAWRGPAASLAAWADRATTGELASVSAACRDGVVLLVGGRLPPTTVGERFVGEGLLVPVGMRPEPDWPADALRVALGIEPGEIALLTANGVEAVPRAALRPVTRAGLRMAMRRG